MPNKLPESAWEQMRQLFIQGLSIRQIAARTGTAAGTVAARASRERWSAQRKQLAAVKQESSPNDREGMIREIVLENKLKTLEAESRSARLLAERALKAIEDNGIEVKNLGDVESTQKYRERLWPSTVEPEMAITFNSPGNADGDGRSILEAALARGEKVELRLYYAHERIDDAEPPAAKAKIIEGEPGDSELPSPDNTAGGDIPAAV